MSKVYLPSRLRTVANNQTWLEIDAATLQELLTLLTAQFPDIAALIMQDNKLNSYTRVFVNSKEALDLGQNILAHDEIHIIQAMAGG